MNIQDNVKRQLDLIRCYEHEYHRESNSVILLAVSKKKTLTDIIEAYRSGIIHFGESYVQEAVTKIKAMQDKDAVWHFIGRVQKNKTREIAKHFSYVHSLSSLEHAKKLNEYRPRELGPLNVFIQVNLDNESSKSGIQLNLLPQLINEIKQLPALKITGLMAIPIPVTDFSLQLKSFQRFALLQKQLIAQGEPLSHLSMGVSHDFKAAIAAGSTIVRLGTVIFGRRD